MKCKICNSDKHNSYEAREMMFGLRDKFVYLECLECGCLQIAQIPADLSKYYPEEYYSFSSSISKISAQKNTIKKFFKTRRDNFILFKKDWIGRIVNSFYPNDYLAGRFPGMDDIFSLKKSTKILDVGCGNGLLVYFLKECGLEKCLGVDPYIQKDTTYDNGLKILKKTIHELHQEFDLIMLHHSFEHVSDPLETLRSVQRLLSKEGICLIRIPTVSSYAWKHYRGNWVQLDAPRHLFLHSVQSMKLLAQKADLRLVKVCYDSTDFQFWGSEQYVKDIPLYADNSYFKNTKNSMFSEQEIRNFKKRARRLNEENQGDAAAFYFQKV